MSNSAKIKYHANQIIKLADNSSNLCKECPKYRMPDLSKLSPSINKELVKALWNNYHKATSSWTCWMDIYRHGTQVMGFSDKQMKEIGVAFGFLEDEEEPEPPVYLCGNSARQILHSHVGLAPPINGSNFLFEYEDRIIANRKKGGINLVREDIIDVERWGSLIAHHTEKFINEGIKIIYTLADADVYGYGDYKKSCQFLKPYADHIFCGAENEIMDDDNVDEVIDRVKYIEDTGLVSLTGQWGWSHHGEEKSKELLEKYQPMIIGMARPYPPEQAFIAWIDYLKGFKRKIIEVEFLMDDAIEIEKYARIGFDKGLYGFNNYLGDHLELMGRLAREFNQ